MKYKKLLYKSFDADLPEKQKWLLKNELDDSAELHKEFMEIKKMRNAVSESKEESFKLFFEERLLDRLNKVSYGKESLNGWAYSIAISFDRIAITAIILLIILISYNLKSGENYSFESLFGKSNSTIVSAYDPIQNLIIKE